MGIDLNLYSGEHKLSDHRVCPKCGIKKPIISGFYFTLNRNGKYYVRSRCKECFHKESLRYWEKHPEKMGVYMKTYFKKFPWIKNYKSAKSRCNSNGKYGKRGIKFLMTLKDFKYLWFRDKAYLMEKPSIDRIDSKGNYELKNCRYLEFLENCRRTKRIKKDA